METLYSSTPSSINKKCPECNSEFNCSTNDCWCSKMPLVIPLDISKECLCPTCLDNLIQQKMARKEVKL